MVVIVDYGVGNLNSIQNMIRRSGHQAIISGDPDVVQKASKFLLPGMGHFDNCMSRLTASGLLGILENKVLKEKVPLLGICVGLQMLMSSSEEGVLSGLGWIDGKTIRFKEEQLPDNLKVPNMGWLEVNFNKPSKLQYNLEAARYYFAHSYHVKCEDQSDVLISSPYGYTFTAAIERDNLLGVQFHPEKSHRFGMQLLKNFVELY